MLRSFAGTDSGRVRGNNEDSFLCAADLYIVADGMGGHKAGEIASKLLVKSVADYVAACRQYQTDRQQMLIQSFKKANEIIMQKAVDNPGYRGMGTTATAVFIEDDTVYWAHVGDSRLYLIVPVGICQVTGDHSVVAELVRGGELDESEAAIHPQKHMLTRAIGVDSVLEVDSDNFEWSPDSYLLLCSDGLTNMLSDQEIFDLISETGLNDDNKAESLINMANAKGGHDNVTVVLLKNITE